MTDPLNACLPAEPVLCAGVDLAWQSAKNPSAAALGLVLSGSGSSAATLKLTQIHPRLFGIDQVLAVLSEPLLHGVAIDAPLIINNTIGMRSAERELSRAYGSRKAGCHPSNLSLYPNPQSAELARRFTQQGFAHLAAPGLRFQIECYPHPALIEIFNLPERHRYKKGLAADRRTGQAELGELLASLSSHPRLKLALNDHAAQITQASYIESLRGAALKSNEDALDAIVCLYIAALYAEGSKSTTFGNVEHGYIWIPRPGFQA